MLWLHWQEIQDKVVAEVETVCGQRDIEYEDVNKLTYTMATILGNLACQYLNCLVFLTFGFFFCLWFFIRGRPHVSAGMSFF
jgi:hypothetical protein